MFFMPATIVLDVVVVRLAEKAAPVMLLHSALLISCIIQVIEFSGHYELKINQNILFDGSFMQFLFHFVFQHLPLFGTVGLVSLKADQPIQIGLSKLKLNIFDNPFIRSHALFYLIVTLLFQPQPSLNGNVLIEFCLNLPTFFTSPHSHNALTKSPWEYPPDFKDPWIVNNMNTTKRIDTKFKHVVLIVGESVSSSFCPFYNFSIPTATKKEKSFNPIGSVDFFFNKHSADGLLTSPFLHSLMKHEQQVLIATKHISPSSYTIKALISILCGVYPLNSNYNLEMGYRIHEKCIPALLNANGFKSIFMQPSDIFFDGQYNIIDQQMKFDRIVHRKVIRERYPDLAETNYFGYADGDLLPFVKEELEQLGNKQRLFMTILTSVSHHPWLLPSTDKNLLLDETTDSIVNKYISTMRYTDKLIKELMSTVESEMGKEFMDDTLFVFTGDHGVSMSNNLYGSINNWYQSGFEVPLVMYSSRKGWNSVGVKPHVTSNHVDILQTLLDMLHVNVPDEANYQGQSIIRTPIDRPHILIVSPGNSHLIVVEGTFKAVFNPETLFLQTSNERLKSYCLKKKPNCRTDKLLDIKNDPYEMQNLYEVWYDYHTDGTSKVRIDILEWFGRARQLAFDFSRRNRIKYGFFYST